MASGFARFRDGKGLGLYTGATITVNGAPVTSGAASPPVALPLGPTPVMIVVTAADGIVTKDYAVVFTRAGLAGQENYLKPSNLDADDQFGYSVAVSGDTLVVGAWGESSAVTA